MDRDTTHNQWIEAAMKQFERPLIGYALRLLGNLETAREVVQDTFLKLCDQDPEQIGDHLGPWLFTVCRRRAVDVARRTRPMAGINPDNAHLHPVSAEPAPGAGLDQLEVRQLVLHALDRLPSEQQEVIRLRFQQSLSYQEIAGVTGLTPSYVGYLIHMGIKAMREEIRASELAQKKRSRPWTLV